MTTTQELIFVFGSNTAGRHGAGAAAHAHRRLGAVWGVGEGPTGSTYALPTKYDHNGKLYTSPPIRIKEAVDKFIEHAKEHPERMFQVTCVGCGLAGLHHADMAPLFENAPDNCYFDTLWKEWLPNKKFWGTF